MRPTDSPPSERTRDLDDILLRVSAVNAEGVELEKFSRVIFVEAAHHTTLRHRVWRRLRRAAPTRQPLHLRRRMWIRAHPVVQVHQHGRAFGRGPKQLAETTKNMRANRLALVLTDVNLCLSLAREHVEVVEPKVDEDFLELTFAVHGAHEFGFSKLRENLTSPPHICVHRQRL